MTGLRFVIPPGFAERVTGALGVEATAWLDALPVLIHECAERWHLDIGAPFELSYGYVAPARTRGGDDVVLKAALPNDETRRQIAALRLYGGDGACRLVDADETRCVLLLERVQPGDTLEVLARRDDQAATRVAASVMRALWRPVPDGATFLPLATWFEAFPRYRAAYPAGGPLLSTLLAHAEQLASDLLDSTDDPQLLHGDLHHGNILDAGGGRWLAIDPKGVVGDHGYEVGPFLLNPLDLTLDARLLHHRIEVLEEALSYDGGRLRDWGIVHAVLSGCWSLEDHGGGWQRAVGAAEVLRAL